MFSGNKKEREAICNVELRNSILVKMLRSGLLSPDKVQQQVTTMFRQERWDIADYLGI
jgi:hypothetical protein